MSALERVPQNTNYLQPTKFLLTFDRIGSVTYFCQEVNLPGVNLGSAPINFPMLDVHAPGTKLTFNPLNVQFILDEGLVGWQQLYEWFNSIASPEGFDKRNSLTEKQNVFKQNRMKNYSDATLTVLSNLNNPIVRIQFFNTYPTSLSDVQFDTKLSAEDIMTGTVSFNYDYFKFLPI